MHDDRGIEVMRERRLLPPVLDDGERRRLATSGTPTRDAFRGALVGCAIGDALGRAVEGWPRRHIEAAYGRLDTYQPWWGWDGGPVGTATDDTQLTVCVAEWLLAAGDGHEPDPTDLATRFVDWYPTGRGKGRACTAAVHNLMDGLPWHEAGVGSAGNGAAMRVAPIGLALHGDLDRLREVSALSAVVTHAHPMAVASAVVQAYLVGWLTTVAPATLDPGEAIHRARTVIADLHEPGEPERRPDADPERRVRLVDRVGEVGDWLDAEPGDAFDHFYNGAFVLESLPSGLWCFLRSPEDPGEVVVTAANGGRDADTVAAMAGALAGAYLGESAFPEHLAGDDLELGDRCRALADALFDSVSSGPAPAPP